MYDTNTVSLDTQYNEPHQADILTMIFPGIVNYYDYDDMKLNWCTTEPMLVFGIPARVYNAVEEFIQFILEGRSD
jgi:hypothetical protein